MQKPKTSRSRGSHRNHGEQGDLFLDRGRGGKRSGAGRPKKRGSGVSHRRRAALSAHTPVHVTMRAARGLALRKRAPFRAIHAGIRAAQERFGFRVVHFSVQHDHVHLIVEADDARSLARGMQGMTIRFARGINKALDRSGKVFVDRYHAQQLRTPTQVRHAIRYVLSNVRKHLAENGIRVAARFVDPFSSAPHFDGWRSSVRLVCPPGPDVAARARSFLLRMGWRRRGLIDPSHSPAAR